MVETQLIQFIYYFIQRYFGVQNYYKLEIIKIFCHLYPKEIEKLKKLNPRQFINNDQLI